MQAKAKGSSDERTDEGTGCRFMGTFALVFLGTGAAAVLENGQFSAIALAHGPTIMVFATALATSAAANRAVVVVPAAAG